MLLLANGCSHTAGAEIEYEWQDNCYEKAYPKFCADTLGWDYKNLAVSGASQERIIRTTIDWVGKNYKSYKNTDIYVVIMWSGPSRTEFYSENIRNYLQMLPNNDEIYKKQFTKVEYLYYKSYITLQNRQAQLVKWYNNIILLQSYLVTFKIKYLFLNASEPLRHANNNLVHLASQINYKNYPWAFEHNNSYLNLLLNRGFKMPEHIKRQNSTHLGGDAHKYYGTMLAKYIKETLNGNI
jgi:hypothetical protein